jgi:hypothetical protein
MESYRARMKRAEKKIQTEMEAELRETLTPIWGQLGYGPVAKGHWDGWGEDTTVEFRHGDYDDTDHEYLELTLWESSRVVVHFLTAGEDGAEHEAEFNLNKLDTFVDRIMEWRKQNKAA